MPQYEVQAPDGRTVTLEGDTPPTEADLDQVFAAIPPKQQPADSSQKAADIATKVKDFVTSDEMKDRYKMSLARMATYGPLANIIPPQIIKQALPEQHKKARGEQITAAEIAGGFALPALSPAIMGIGEASRGMIEGKGIPESFKRGGIAAATDFGLGKVGKGLGWLASKAMSPIVKARLVPKFGEEVVDRVMKNPMLTKKSPYSAQQLEQKVVGGVKGILEKTGKDAGAARAKAVASKAMIDLNPLKKETAELALKQKIPGIAKGVKLAKGDVAAVSTGTGTLKRVVKELGKKPVSIDNAQTILDNVDQYLQPIYQKMKTPGATLSRAEVLAKDLRKKLNQQISDKVSEYAAGKTGYASAKKILGAEGGNFARNLQSPRRVLPFMRSAVRPGREAMFRDVQKLEGVGAGAGIPPSQKFTDPIIQKFVNEELYKPINPVRWAALSALPLELAGRVGAKAMRREPAKITPLLRMLAARLAANQGNQR